MAFTTRMIQLSILGLMGLLALVSSQITDTQVAESGDIVLKAPSNLINCGCQCDPYTWRDTLGRVQGNCRSADATKALWCYIPASAFTSCADIRQSRNRLDNFGRPRRWSYEACSTPALTSPICLGFGQGGLLQREPNKRPTRNNGRRPNRGGNNSGNGSGGGFNLLDLIKPRSEAGDGGNAEGGGFKFQNPESSGTLEQ
eukprot:maker-scaffold381_size190066-snap-gene-0.31 protein:Tk01605 transcript:maker-scaffold381_size190066-snap-gene-0.31-mRNA-1 annotation:"hypothetical protein"